MHTTDDRRFSLADVLDGIDAAVAELDRAIDSLSELAAPGRAHGVAWVTRCEAR